MNSWPGYKSNRNRKHIGPLTKAGSFLSACAVMRKWRSANLERARSRWRKWRKDNPRYWIQLGNRFSRMKQTAKRRGISIGITLEQYKQLVKNKPCHYCGASLDESAGWSLDRLDNAKGYILGNCVPCCYWCNYMKMDHTVEQFYAQIRKILARANALESTKKQ